MPEITSKKQELFFRAVAGGTSTMKPPGLTAAKAKEILEEEGFSVDQGNLFRTATLRINGRTQDPTTEDL